MESILKQSNDEFEVVVCDNCSNDGSREILEQYAKRGKIRLIVEKSSRGKGRQIAFQMSTGNYIISGIDTDDFLNSGFLRFLHLYHKDHEGFMLSAGTIHIIPRELVNQIGGWRDLQWGEDVDFHKRAQISGKHHEISFSNIVERGENKRNLLARASEQYNASLCCYRIGKGGMEQLKIFQWHHKPLVIFFVIAALIRFKIDGRRVFGYVESLGKRN